MKNMVIDDIFLLFGSLFISRSATQFCLQLYLLEARRTSYENPRYLISDSILFYPITLGGRRGTTDDFAS